MNTEPVNFLIINSNLLTFLKYLAIVAVLYASNKAKIKTGIPVANPNTAGRSIVNLVFIVIGIKLPKNSAADIGQNDKAKKNPNKNELITFAFTLFSYFLGIGVLNEKLNLIIFSKIKPEISKTGPINLLMFLCKNIAKIFIFIDAIVISNAIVMYEITLPKA